jgi:hypothetical protein
VFRALLTTGVFVTPCQGMGEDKVGVVSRWKPPGYNGQEIVRPLFAAEIESMAGSDAF